MGFTYDLLLRRAQRLREQDPFGYLIFTDEELIKVVKRELKDKKTEWKKRRSGEDNGFVSKKRPYFGKNQVRSRDEIKKSNFYFSIYDRLNSCEFIEVLSDPYLNQINWCMEIYSHTYNRRKKLYLSDVSIEPYKDGYWHRSNFLLNTEFRKMPSPEATADIINSLKFIPL